MNWVGGVRRRVVQREYQEQRQKNYFAQHSANALRRRSSQDQRSNQPGPKYVDLPDDSHYTSTTQGRFRSKPHQWRKEEIVYERIRPGTSSQTQSFSKKDPPRGKRGRSTKQDSQPNTRNTAARIKPTSIHGPFSAYLLKLEREALEKKYAEEKKQTRNTRHGNVKVKAKGQERELKKHDRIGISRPGITSVEDQYEKRTTHESSEGKNIRDETRNVLKEDVNKAKDKIIENRKNKQSKIKENKAENKESEKFKEEKRKYYGGKREKGKETKKDESKRKNMFKGDRRNDNKERENDKGEKNDECKEIAISKAEEQKRDGRKEGQNRENFNRLVNMSQTGTEMKFTKIPNWNSSRGNILVQEINRGTQLHTVDKKQEKKKRLSCSKPNCEVKETVEERLSDSNESKILYESIKKRKTGDNSISDRETFCKVDNGRKATVKKLINKSLNDYENLGDVKKRKCLTVNTNNDVEGHKSQKSSKKDKENNIELSPNKKRTRNRKTKNIATPTLLLGAPRLRQVLSLSPDRHKGRIWAPLPVPPEQSHIFTTKSKPQNGDIEKKGNKSNKRLTHCRQMISCNEEMEDVEQSKSSKWENDRLVVLLGSHFQPSVSGSSKDKGNDNGNATTSHPQFSKDTHTISPIRNSESDQETSENVAASGNLLTSFVSNTGRKQCSLDVISKSLEQTESKGESSPCTSVAGTSTSRSKLSSLTRKIYKVDSGLGFARERKDKTPYLDRSFCTPWLQSGFFNTPCSSKSSTKTPTDPTIEASFDDLLSSQGGADSFDNTTPRGTVEATVNQADGEEFVSESYLHTSWRQNDRMTSVEYLPMYRQRADYDSPVGLVGLSHKPECHDRVEKVSYSDHNGDVWIGHRKSIDITQNPGYEKFSHGPNESMRCFSNFQREKMQSSYSDFDSGHRSIEQINEGQERFNTNTKPLSLLTTRESFPNESFRHYNQPSVDIPYTSYDTNPQVQYYGHRSYVSNERVPSWRNRENIVATAQVNYCSVPINHTHGSQTSSQFIQNPHKRQETLEMMYKNPESNVDMQTPEAVHHYNTQSHSYYNPVLQSSHESLAMHNIPTNSIHPALEYDLNNFTMHHAPYQAYPVLSDEIQIVHQTTKMNQGNQRAQQRNYISMESQEIHHKNTNRSYDELRSEETSKSALEELFSIENVEIKQELMINPELAARQFKEVMGLMEGQGSQETIFASERSSTSNF